MNLIEQLEKLPRWDKYRNIDPRGEFVKAEDLRAIIEQAKREAVEPEHNCLTCPNNRDVVCAYCEGSGLTECTDGEMYPCPQGCKQPVEANVFNRKEHKLFGRWVSYVSSSEPINIGTKLYTALHPDHTKLIGELVKALEDANKKIRKAKDFEYEAQEHISESSYELNGFLGSVAADISMNWQKTIDRNDALLKRAKEG